MRKIWIFGILGIILTLLFIGYDVRLQRNIALEQSHATTNALADSVERDLVHSFSGLDQMLFGLRNTIEAYANTTVDAPAIRRVIDGLLQNNPYLTSLIVLDNKGQILHWNNNLQKPDLSQRDYFLFHKTHAVDGLYIGRPQPSVINQNQKIFGVSRGFHDDNGNLNMVIVAIIDVNFFARQYEKLFTRADSQLTIFSPQGDIYTRIPEHEVMRFRRIDQIATLLRNGKIPPDGVHLDSPGGKTIFMTIHKLTGYPLVISIAKTENTTFTNWQKDAWNHGLLGVFISLTILFLTYRTAKLQRRQTESIKKLELLSITDALTGLSNRRYAMEQAKTEIKRAQRHSSTLSLIMLDLDHFSRINEDYGDASGDEALSALGGLLLQACRETDIVSRFEGEAFLLILPATELEGAIKLAEKIRETLSSHVYDQPQVKFHITASLGVTQLGVDEMDINGALLRVKSALQEAKGTGRNNVKWLPSNIRDEDNLNQSIWFSRLS
ncbi:sensor domain-containing diguanylate cyclase [Geopsychrobacter electrodiphilus]|uniref:sensor domain-containing diguanylate cyclase n=1 Tax=Geopsychrobacter electrodiphilus TaxID=225196 RepID=UPI00037300C0|nr:diguanylate cyclase [Geopsychrobacter electrodiphilus]